MVSHFFFIFSVKCNKYVNKRKQLLVFIPYSYFIIFYRLYEKYRFNKVMLLQFIHEKLLQNSCQLRRFHLPVLGLIWSSISSISRSSVPMTLQFVTARLHSRNNKWFTGHNRLLYFDNRYLTLTNSLLWIHNCADGAVTKCGKRILCD